MPSTYIPLQEVILAAEERGEKNAFIEKLLCGLELGAIGSISGRYRKCGIEYLFKSNDLRDAIERLVRGEKLIDTIQSAVETQSLYRRFVRIDNSYYSIYHEDGLLNIYGYGDFEVYHKIEIEPTHWKNCWIDESRWVVIFEELQDKSRYEYKDVGISREDHDLLLLKSSKQKTSLRGRPPEFRHSDIERKARELIENRPSIKYGEFKEIVLGYFGEREMPKDTAFRAIYGKPIFTDLKKARKIGK